MEIYDSHYYSLNKKLLIYTGIWPCLSFKKKLVPRIIITVLFVPTLISQIIYVIEMANLKSIDLFVEHTAILCYVGSASLKFSTSIFYEEKLKILYENLANNWTVMSSRHERSVLHYYTERGRKIVFGYTVFMYAVATAFCLFPSIPIILNQIKPLNESRPRIYVFGGEYFIDREKYFYQIYFADCIVCAVTMVVVTAVDTMYASTIEHCLALFDVIKTYLHTIPVSLENNKTQKETRHLHQIIQLHKNAISFSDILEKTYSFSYLILMGANMLLISTECVMVLIKLDRRREEMLELIRFSGNVCGGMAHLFFINWPGQKLNSISEELFDEAYLNEWYALSRNSKKLLGFLKLRCTKPCNLTAGGIIPMNFTTFAKVVKASLSYMTVFSTFR